MNRLLLLVALALTACQTPPTAELSLNKSLNSPPVATATPPVATQPEEPPTKLVAVVIKDDAYLRNGPGIAGQVINTLSIGDTLTVRHPERGGPWYEVAVNQTNQAGWIHGSLIRFKTGVPSTPTPTPRLTATPAPTSTPAVTDDEDEEADEAGQIKVWVNTNSGVYHCPGTRWYGRTKEGEYMTQADALEADYRPAYGNRCE